MVDELHSALLEQQTHRPLSCGGRADHHLSFAAPLAHRVRSSLVEVDAEAVESTASVDHYCVVWSESAQEGNEVAIAVPLDGELEVRQR